MSVASEAAGIPFIVPDWPAPDIVAACSTTRVGGISEGPYGQFNLGDHVGDDGHAVQSNRRALISALGLSDRPRWLAQVHRTTIVDAESVYEAPEADGALACTPGVAAVVMTADCLPVLFCDTAGTTVAAVHAGWRGLAGGVLQAAIGAFRARGIVPEEMLTWIGPAISQRNYEVGDEVRAAFPAAPARFFAPSPAGRWLFDLAGLARHMLQSARIGHVSGGNWCTYADQRFYSFRRDGRCGRQATLIWLKY